MSQTMNRGIFARCVDVIEEVARERLRQIETEGWTATHDDQHANGEMALAASVYATHTIFDYSTYGSEKVPTIWPWAATWWKPTTRRRDLVKAAALIIAEIERLDRREALPSIADAGDQDLSGPAPQPRPPSRLPS